MPLAGAMRLARGIFLGGWLFVLWLVLCQV